MNLCHLSIPDFTSTRPLILGEITIHFVTETPKVTQLQRFKDYGRGIWIDTREGYVRVLLPIILRTGFQEFFQFYQYLDKGSSCYLLPCPQKNARVHFFRLSDMTAFWLVHRCKFKMKRPKIQLNYYTLFFQITNLVAGSI